jgi:hypothetical protein
VPFIRLSLLFLGSGHSSIVINITFFKIYFITKYSLEIAVLLFVILISTPIKSYDNSHVLNRQLPETLHSHHQQPNSQSSYASDGNDDDEIETMALVNDSYKGGGERRFPQNYGSTTSELRPLLKGESIGAYHNNAITYV